MFGSIHVGDCIDLNRNQRQNQVPCVGESFGTNLALKILEEFESPKELAAQRGTVLSIWGTVNLTTEGFLSSNRKLDQVSERLRVGGLALRQPRTLLAPTVGREEIQPLGNTE